MKTILVTGASRGIGRATTLALSEADAPFERLVLVGRASSAFEESVAEAKAAAAGKDIVAIEADLDDPEIVTDIFAQLDAQGIKLHAIVNNAGFAKPTSLNETRHEDFERSMRINVYSPFRIIQAAVVQNHPLEQILNIASTAGINGRAGWLSYSTSKAAMINMSEVLSDELKPYGIDVICLSPGRCATDLRRTLAPDEDPSTIMQPEQVAEIIKFMMSDTGKLLHSQNLVVRT
ncbi:MAG: SDR family oxidoreductase [Octadecabacter sp.]|jgi:3-oxoacyl-[acyl-carrier protein] reductase|nr:SDR family oxidoreductase [Octadecabacter sp.]